MNISVISPAKIAMARFLPAMRKINEIDFVGVGVCTKDERLFFNSSYCTNYEQIREKQLANAEFIKKKYGGTVFNSYEEAITSPNVDAVYIPLPPALHYKWARMAIKHGKHVMIEKPATISLDETIKLVEFASSKGVALHENYMFTFHTQIKKIKKIIESGELGDIRLYRLAFGFPKKDNSDFRYNSKLGGGALLDAGGYTIKYASELLGNTAKIVQAQSNYIENVSVDVFGSCVMSNGDGITAHLAFGMDNDYKCELEVWGSKGTLYTNRIFTAPVDYQPTILISKNGDKKRIELASDDTFQKSIHEFRNCIADKKIREKKYREIIKQADYVDVFKAMAVSEERRK